LFIPELIVDKLNSDGRFKNDLTGVNTEQNYGNNNKKVDSEIFSEIDVDAEFIGGVNALMKFLSENINYPHTSMVNNIQGKVIVAFVVETDGSLSNITIKKGITDDLNKEAIRIVSSMPKWKPAEKNGNVVRSKCSLPINFLLNE
jgi:TonB family protein